jgi:hypothetical protein
MLAFLLAMGPAPAEEPARHWRVGIHGGSSDIVPDLERNVSSQGLALRRRVASPDWLAAWLPRGIDLELEGMAARLSAENEDAVHLAAGPVLVWRARNAPWLISGGTRAGWISDHSLGDQDLGGPLQFTSHIGAGIVLGRHATIELQWRHTSNAHLYSDNDGLDVQALGLGWHF